MWKIFKTNQGTGFGTVVTISGGAASIVGLLGVSGWITGLRILASIRSDYVPMSPDTALAFVVLGLVLFFFVRIRENGGSKLFVSAIIAIVSIYGLLKSAEYFVNTDLTFENILFPATEKIGSFFTKRMSPIAGTLFFLSGVALQLKLSLGARRQISNVISGLGVITLSVGFVATTGYVFGTPLLYGGDIIPLAATTTIGFLFLGFGLVAMAGPENIFVQLFVGNSASARLLRFLLPITISAVLLESFLAKTLTNVYGVNHALADALLSLAYVIIMGAVVVHLSKVVFRRADIAEGQRKRAEEALRKSEERFRSIYENSTMGLYRTTPAGKIILANPALVKMLGYSSFAELSARNLEQEGFEPSYERKQFIDKIEKDGEVKGLESVWDRQDDKAIFVRESARAIRDQKGNTLYYDGTVEDITERKRAEEELRESERRFREMLDNVDLIAMTLSKEGTVTFCNDYLLQMSGWKRAEVLDADWFSTFLPDGNPMVKELFTQSISTGIIPAHHENSIVTKAGKLREVYWNNTFLRDAMGNIIGMASIGEDITERKRAEEELKKSEEKYRGIFENVQDVYYETSLEGTILEVSPSIKRLSRGQYQRDDLIGKSMYDFYADPRERNAILSELQTRGRVTDFEMLLKNRDGSRVPCSISAIIWLDDQGQPGQIIGSLRDVTERKKAEESRLLLTTALESTANGVTITDLKGNIVWVNKAFTLMTGYALTEVIGQNPRILKSGKQDDSFYQDLWETISAGNVWTGELINKRKDGSVYTDETTITPLKNENAEITNFIAIKQDITERKRAEETKRGLEAQLQQAQKLESIGTLASGIAHDFNNILGIILGYATLLERLKEDPEQLAESVKAITRASERGASVVRQLLTFARKTEALIQVVRINDVIEEITKLLRETLPKTITISSYLQKDLPAIVADAGQIHQVLLNLCVNARDAMPSSGTLSISTGTIDGKAVGLQFSKATARQYVQIEVTDTGIGMDEATRQRIFEPFFTTKGPGKGTGLGLAVVFGIVEHHSGFIDVQSAPGKGTSFVLYFPITELAPEIGQRVSKSIEEIPGGTETILVIEDEEMLRSLAKGILVSKGYKVLIAEDGMQGVEMYQTHQKEIAVVLSDIGLPTLSGQDVFRKIREINPKAKVILASGFFDPATKSEMFKVGLKNFIQKPYMHDEVLQKIRETIDANQ